MMFFSLVFVRQAYANCPYEIGQTVSPIPAEKAYERLSAFEMIKSEYETMEEFESRKQSVLTSVTPLLIAGLSVPKGFIEYDAENRRLVVGESFASPISLEAEVSKRLRPKSRAIDANSTIAYDINPMNGSALKYLIFVNHVERNVRRTAWIMDENFPDLDYPEIIHELVYLYVNPATAKAIRDDLRVAFYVTPSTPFIYYHSPYVSDPRKRGYKYKIIFSDIHCAMITDSNGTVLKTINPNRSGVAMTNPAPFSQPLEPFLNRPVVVEPASNPVAAVEQMPNPVAETLPAQQSVADAPRPSTPIPAPIEMEIPEPRVKPVPPPEALAKCKAKKPDKFCTAGHF